MKTKQEFSVDECLPIPAEGVYGYRSNAVEAWDMCHKKWQRAYYIVTGGFWVAAGTEIGISVSKWREAAHGTD